MVKPTQTIRRLSPTNCLSVFDHFVGLAPNRLRNYINSQLLYFLVFLLSSLLFSAFDFFCDFWKKKKKITIKKNCYLTLSFTWESWERIQFLLLSFSFLMMNSDILIKHPRIFEAFFRLIRFVLDKTLPNC